MGDAARMADKPLRGRALSSMVARFQGYAPRGIRSVFHRRMGDAGFTLEEFELSGRGTHGTPYKGGMPRYQRGHATP